MRFCLFFCSILLLCSCVSTTKSPVVSRTLSQLLTEGSQSKGGGYYQDDGPHGTIPSHLDSVPNAQVQWEPLNKSTMKPYTVLGKRYVPNKTLKPYKEKGLASWYGKKFHGKKTSIGEPYDMYAMTAAHKTLALPSYVKVTRVATGKSVIVRLTDRGPFHAGRIIDLSYTAAHQLGIVEKGSDWVVVEAILPNQNQTAQRSSLKKSTAQVLSATRGMASADLARQQEDTLTKRLKENVLQLENLIQQKEISRAQTQVVAKIENEIAKDFDALEAFADKIEDDQTLNHIQNIEVLADATIEKAQTKIQQVASSTTYAKQFFVQLGAFSSMENAENAKARFLADLPWLDNAVEIYAKDQLHRVQIGPYPSRSAAQKLINRIAKETGLHPSLSTQ